MNGTATKKITTENGGKHNEPRMKNVAAKTFGVMVKRNVKLFFKDKGIFYLSYTVRSCGKCMKIPFLRACKDSDRAWIRAF